MSRAARIATIATIAALGLPLAACGAGANAAPSWSPQPQFTAVMPPVVPELPPLPTQPGGSTPSPQPSAPGGPSTPSTGAPSSPSPSGGSTTTAADPAVVATRLSAPTGVAVLPDGTALVGERDTGRIVRVQPRPGQPVRVLRTLPGLDASGDGGLLDLALSPTYVEDGLVYAYVTTPTDNRVIDFTLTGPTTPVLTGIPKGPTGNTGRIAFDDAGDLYIGTGDAGAAADPENPASLAGKVLRVSQIGRPATGNPGGSAVYANGARAVDGLCADAGGIAMFLAQAHPPAAADQIDLVRAGADFGTAVPPLATMPDGASGIGGCAVVGSTLYVTSRDGTSLLAATITAGVGAANPSIGKFTAILTKKYGRLLTVVAAPDGALWLTTCNRDGHGKPIADDERVLRIVPAAGGAEAPRV
ncbi:MAG: PQQ-dependent sugar dehydrogenase [Actinomycetia bacterium]|nr:PQQ-dependent sugar dehydrogenase [Actinomycetes bacterium]